MFSSQINLLSHLNKFHLYPMYIANMAAITVPLIIPIICSLELRGYNPVITRAIRPMMSAMSNIMASAAAHFFIVSISSPAPA